MYRILIADDEAIERQGLELMISRTMPGTFEFSHAENGRIAIEKAEQENPDIIFMDIKMPGIQGIDAIKEITQKHSHSKIVLVTAYDYFGYAKEALKLGVQDYLLKPKKKEQVLDVVKKLIEKIESEKMQRSEELKQRETITQLLPLLESEICLMIMMNFILDKDFDQLNELLKLKIHKGYSTVISLPTDDGDQYEPKKQYLYSTIKNFIKMSGKDCLVSPLIGNRITLFTNFPEDHRVTYSVREEATLFAEKVHHFICKEYNIKASIGIGTMREGVEGLRSSYYEASMVLSNPSNGQPIHYYSKQKTGQEKELTLRIEEQLFTELTNLKIDCAIQIFHQTFDMLVETTNGDVNRCRGEVTELFITLNKYLFRQGVSIDGIGNFSEAIELEQLRHAAEVSLHLIVEVISKDKQSKTESLIEQAKKYIQENYSKEISMELVAEMINLSPYYFSKIFKKIEGTTFIDYLTFVRIEKSKQLLLDHNLSLKEICFRVGYNDPNYFSRVFKKVTEFSPSEYRNQLVKY